MLLNYGNLRDSRLKRREHGSVLQWQELLSLYTVQGKLVMARQSAWSLHLIFQNRHVYDLNLRKRMRFFYERKGDLFGRFPGSYHELVIEKKRHTSADKC